MASGVGFDEARVVVDAGRGGRSQSRVARMDPGSQPEAPDSITWCPRVSTGLDPGKEEG